LLQLQLGWGFFLTMGVGNWAGFEEAVELLAEEPALVREIMAIHGAFHARMADRVLSVVDPDFACLSEPLCTVHGPLISPHAYEEIVLASYLPVFETLRLRGVKTVVYMTFSNARSLLPAVFRSGFNCLWAYERAAAGMDYSAIRNEFGSSLKLIGGLDTDAILAGGKAMRREVESRVAELWEVGGYIPQADGRIRPNMPMRNYIEYRRVLDRAVGKGRKK
jgi:uroporphyrinogen-III decarboxylase